MMQGAETRLDGDTLVVRIPMRFQRRGGPQADRGAGRQRARADDQAAARRHAGQGARRAWRWQRMLDEGRFASVRDLAEAERVGLSYISRILRLTLLAPDIVEEILDGRPTAGLAQLLKPFPVGWEQQREIFE